MSVSVRWLVDFPQAREAPSDVRAGLRALDPTAEVIYLGPRHWVVGRVRPNTQARKIAEGMLASAATVLSTRARESQSRRLRVALAVLGLQGFRPVAEYHVNDLDGRVVREFAESQWRMLHTSDDALFRELDAEDEARKATAQRELGSLERAREAHRVAFTSNFGYGVSSVAKPTPTRSGFSRVALT